jgi:hypothetical protein
MLFYKLDGLGLLEGTHFTNKLTTLIRLPHSYVDIILYE